MTLRNAFDVWQSDLPKLASDAHKYSRGHMVMLGSQGLGASYLATTAAPRMGAGIVTLLCDKEYLIANSLKCEPHIVVRAFDTVDQAVEMLQGPTNSAFVIGPGFAPGDKLWDDLPRLALAVLATGKPCVLDAGAITAFKGRAEELFPALHDKVVLTPHEGEFLRLFGPIEERQSAVENATAHIPSVVLLKGPETLIAQNGQETIINQGAPACLATAGTGDVLAGMIGSLLAQGMPPFKAAAAGVHYHAQAAIGSQLGRSMTATDLLPALINIGSTLGQRIFARPNFDL